MSFQKSDNGSSADWSTTAVTGSDPEKDMFKEKIQHYQIMIRQLELELNSTKVRREGAETVARLLMEARQEIALLTKNNKQLESGIQTLQSRLEKNNLSTSLETDEHEIYIPQTSKQILDNLAKENSRLRVLLRQCTVNPDEIENEKKLLQEKTNQVEELTARLQAKQRETDQLDAALKASDSLKDKHIAEYHGMIQKMQQESKMQNVICHSLGEESTNLRKQLRDVAVTCQQMVIKLDEREKSAKQVKEPANIPYIVNQNVTNVEIVERLKEELAKLKVRNKEISEMNQRWQDYNTEREERMKVLQLKNQDLETRLQHLSVDSKNDQANTLIIKSRERIEKMREDLERKDAELTVLKTENRQLQHQQQVQNIGNIDADKEALLVQIQMYKEDFQSERRDREKAHSEFEKQIQHLLRENTELRHQQQLKQQLQQQLGNPMFLPRSPQPQNRYAYPQSPHSPTDNGLTARGGVIRSRIVTDSAEEITVCNPPSLSPEPGKVSPQPNRMEKTQETTVACPKCGKEYLSDEHQKLLEHISECCD